MYLPIKEKYFSSSVKKILVEKFHRHDTAKMRRKTTSVLPHSFNDKQQNCAKIQNKVISWYRKQCTNLGEPELICMCIWCERIRLELSWIFIDIQKRICWKIPIQQNSKHTQKNMCTYSDAFCMGEGGNFKIFEKIEVETKSFSIDN